METLSNDAAYWWRHRYRPTLSQIATPPACVRAPMTARNVRRGKRSKQYPVSH